MRKMYYNLIRAKQAKALMLHFYDKGKKQTLSISEYAVLRALAERMAAKTIKPKRGQIPTVAHTCFPSLESIARDAAMSESTASRAIDGLIEKELITKEVIHNWTWKGRKDRTPKHNGVRYRITEIWDRIPVVEYGEDGDEDERETTEVSAEELAEAERVLAEDIDLAVATKHTGGTSPTKEQIDEVIEWIKHYFAEHNTFTTQSEKDARRSVALTAQDLARRAITEGDLEYAWKFLLWLINRHRSVHDLLMSGKVKNLCVSFGLPRYIAGLWDEFVLEREDDYGQYDFAGDSDEMASDAPEIDGQDDPYEAYDFETIQAAAGTAAPIFTRGDEDDIPAPEPTDPALNVVPVAAPVMVPPPIKPEYRADIELKALLRKVPSDQTEASFTLPDDHRNELIEYLRTTFGDDCFISGGSAWITGHRANEFLWDDRFFDPYAKERTMYDWLVKVVENECKKSFAAILRDFNLANLGESGITREHYKLWVGDRYSEFVSVSDLSYGPNLIVANVSLHKGIKLLQFAEYLKDNPFVPPLVSVPGQASFAMAS